MFNTICHSSRLVLRRVIIGHSDSGSRDFNIHYDDAKQSEPLRMLLRSFNFIQHVDVATHQCGHTLDLVITHDDDDLLSSVTVTPDSLSDHHRVEVKLNAHIPPPRTSTICRRSFKRTDVNALTDDITAACAAMCDCTAVTGHSAEQLTSRYNAHLDKHTPLAYQNQNCFILPTYNIQLQW